MELQSSMNRDLNSFVDDFKNLKALKSVIIDEILELSEKSKEDPLFVSSAAQDASMRTLQDGRQYRRLYPCGITSLVDQIHSEAVNLWFVGFFGTRIPANCVDPKWIEALWDIDNQLLKELGKFHVLTYSSCEVTPKGQWFNLVLLQNLEAIDHWGEAKGHDVAVRDISPNIYSKVRIHAGSLQGHITGGAFKVLRTTFVEFGQGKMKGRDVKYWNGNTTIET